MSPEDLKLVWFILKVAGVGVAFMGLQYFGELVIYIGLAILLVGILWEVLYRFIVLKK